MGTRAGFNEGDGRFWRTDDDDAALRQYRTLISAIDDGVYQLDSDGNFVAVNDTIVETTGYEREELLDEHVSLIMADDDVSAVENAVASRLDGESEETEAFELGLRAAGGETVPCELRITPLVEDGELRGTIGVVRDRTDSKRRLDTFESPTVPSGSVTDVLDEADIGVFVLDDGFEVAWADETVEQYFGLDRDAIVGRDKRALVDETVKRRFENPERFAETVLATYEDNSYVERFECQVEPGDDRDGRWLEHYSKPIESGRYAGGRIELYYDITDRKRSESALRESREEFRSLVDTVEEYAIFRLDPDGRVISWNTGAERIKEYDREEILGESFSVFYTPEDRAAGVPERNLERATERGSLEDEGWRVRADGSQFWANVTITPIRDADGTHRGYLKVTKDMTERRRREQRLENELEDVFSRITDAFYAVDEEFRFTHVNDRAEELLQHPEEDLLGERLWDVFPSAAEIDEVWTAFHTAQETQEATSYEVYYDTLGFWVEANLYPSETGISVYFRDVTDRKEREQYLEDTKEQLEAATEAGAVGTWEWNVAEDTFVAGASFARTFGLDPERAREGFPLERVLSSIHEDDRDRVAARIEDALERCGEYEAEYRVRDADGEIRWVFARGHVECDEAGEAETFPGALTDITERKRAELEAETQRRQLETLFRVLPVGAVVADADGSLVRANAAAREIWGGDVFDADSVDEYEKYAAVWADSGKPVEPDEWTMSQVLRGEEVTEPNVYEIRTFDGERRIIMEHGMPVRDERGDVDRAVVTLTDITERREYQRRLEETVDRLETSNERLEDFAYAASHDLQEPLRMVSSYLRLIEDRYGDALDADGEEFLEFAIDGADRMRNMIDGLLEYSRVETKGNPFEPTDLETVVEGVLADLQLRIEESDADVTVDRLPRVNGDPDQLRQVFQNLLSNAIEYSGDEPPVIRVDAERRGEWWTVSVHDEGLGIDPDDQDRIFEVFQRLHGRGEHEGMGIGLAVCQRIVERHGGEIRVDSEPGEGTTFSVTLPAVDES
ncbi:PAS domain-containing sensor histidine kinase [Natronococcus occultus]|uniref:histidine kinase n=1 Tax=Natronococcus occultus SP4 TaxID=694430 RepID=L0JT88_9EURY|nr:PAS domain S-box protein [Natronococcus occultus]AGB36227.1 PAS domain S-box [Natronococcus occultus SP4]